MRVVYEDNHIIIVAKESGEIVQGDKTGDEPLSETVKQYLKEKYQKPGAVFLGVVHRLDRPVAGLVVFARTSKALSRLNKMFAEGEVHKTYWAIVERGERSENRGERREERGERIDNGGERSENRGERREERGERIDNGGERIEDCGELTHWLVRNEQQNKSYAYVREVPRSKKAVLRYRVISQGDRYALLEVQLLTGRHHQIRCQLAKAGMPIRGDLKYGARRSNPDGSISLLSRRVEFVHPVSKENVSVEAPLPADPLWKKLIV